MTDIAEVADRLAIKNLVDRYGLAVDGRDWAMFRTLFAADAVIDYTEFGGQRTGLEASIAWLDAALSVFAAVHHNMTTHVCEIEGSAARGVTYWLAYHALPDGAGGDALMWCGGYYQDRFVKRDGRWWIVERADKGLWLGSKWPEGHPAPPWLGQAQRVPPRLPRK